MPKPTPQTPAILTVPDFEFGSEEAEREVVFKPNPGPQTEFLAASEREVLYGGAAGGKPKSWFSASFSEQSDQNKIRELLESP